MILRIRRQSARVGSEYSLRPRRKLLIRQPLGASGCCRYDTPCNGATKFRAANYWRRNGYSYDSSQSKQKSLKTRRLATKKTLYHINPGSDSYTGFHQILYWGISLRPTPFRSILVRRGHMTYNEFDRRRHETAMTNDKTSESMRCGGYGALTMLVNNLSREICGTWLAFAFLRPLGGGETKYLNTTERRGNVPGQQEASDHYSGSKRGDCFQSLFTTPNHKLLKLLPAKRRR